MQQDNLESLNKDIDELTQLLHDTHIREGVLKAKLNAAIERKFILLRDRQEHLARSHVDQRTTVPVQAFVVNESKRDISPSRVPDEGTNTRHRSRSIHSGTSPTYTGIARQSSPNNPINSVQPEQRVYRDRDGNRLQIGDEVQFLTQGKYSSDTGVVQRFTSKFVHCIDSNNNLTKRSARNVRIIEAYHDCN